MRDGALEMKPGYYIRVRRLSLGALRRRDADALAEAFRADLIEGGHSFVRYLESVEKAP